MKDQLHNDLLGAIKARVPSGTNVANLLTDILCIGKEAAYRRLRGEVPFTLQEIALISNAMDISIDSIIGQNDSIKSKPFQLKLTQYVNSTEADFAQMEEYIAILKGSRHVPGRRKATSSNIFPDSVYFNYPSITKFYLLRWHYQWEGLENVKSLDDIYISPRLNDVFKRYVEESRLIPETNYIWDNLIFYYLVNDIKCYAQVNFITKEDVTALKEDLLILIDDMEELATKGRYDVGGKVNIYLSAVNFESSYTCLHIDNFYLSYVKSFTLNSVVSLDKTVYERLRKWIDSLKRLSTLISESGEIQRVQFFKEQRELVHTLV